MAIVAMVTADQEVSVNVPRDRSSSFEPTLVGKYEKRLPVFNDQIISLYSRGMTLRDIQSHLQEMYAVEVSAELISQVTDAVFEEVREWRARPLESIYPIVYRK